MYKQTRLESEIANFYKRKYCIYTANGTTAMYLAFKALEKQEKKIIFPAITCVNPINAALAAGYEVEFVDVNLENYTMIEHCYGDEKVKQAGIVVPTHTYGSRCHIEKKDNQITFEDAAQTYYVSNADLSVVSFGHTKIFETKYGGGAILTEDKELAERIREERTRLQDCPKNIDELTRLYRTEYYRIVSSDLPQKSRNSKMRELQAEYQKTFIYKDEENLDIIARLKDAPEIIKCREEKLQLYKERLTSPFISFPSDDECGLWRCSFLYSGNRNVLLKEVREKGIDISSWYPSVAQFYKDESLHNASIVERQIVNLWIDESHSINQIYEEINAINKIMKKIEEDY